MEERRKLAVAAAALAVLAALALPVAALADLETPTTGAGAAQQVKKDEGSAAQQPKGATGAVATQSKPLSDHVGEGLVAANIYFVASADDFGRAVRDAPHGVCVLCVRVCCLSVLCACACMCSAHARVHRCMHADATPTQTHARARTHTQALVFFYGRGCIKHQCRPTAWATMDVLAKGVQASVPRVYSGSDAASEASFLSNDNKVGRSKRAAYRARATAVAVLADAAARCLVFGIVRSCGHVCRAAEAVDRSCDKHEALADSHATQLPDLTHRALARRPLARAPAHSSRADHRPDGGLRHVPQGQASCAVQHVRHNRLPHREDVPPQGQL